MRPEVDLESRSEGRPIRIEVPFTSSHWDATILGERFDLARGWERQLDTRYDDGFTLHAAHPGTFLVRVRYTPYWKINSGLGTIKESPGGWTLVTADRHGEVAVDAELSLSA
jgi:hypothetical protein